MVSVILCTHNPRRDYLVRTMESLSRQAFPPRNWELVLVDNASQPPLADLPGWQGAAPARIVREAQPGLTPALVLEKPGAIPMIDVRIRAMGAVDLASPHATGQRSSAFAATNSSESALSAATPNHRAITDCAAIRRQKPRGTTAPAPG